MTAVLAPVNIASPAPIGSSFGGGGNPEMSTLDDFFGGGGKFEMSTITTPLGF
jgi:hypothetical protein